MHASQYWAAPNLAKLGVVCPTLGGLEMDVVPRGAYPSRGK